MKNYKSALMLLLTIIFIGCNKYPEGPSFSLRTAHDRISNTWTAFEITRNGMDVTNEYQQFFLELERDGGAEWRFENNSIITEFIGNWELTDNGRNILFNWGLGTSNEWRILKLKTEEVWFEDERDTVNFVYKMERRD